MHGELPILVLLMVIGVAAFFFGTIYAIGRIIVAIFSAIGSLLMPKRSRRASRPIGIDCVYQFCTRPGCGRLERRRANYCSQCGAPLAKSQRMTDYRCHGR